MYKKIKYLDVENQFFLSLFLIALGASIYLLGSDFLVYLPASASEHLGLGYIFLGGISLLSLRSIINRKRITNI